MSLRERSAWITLVSVLVCFGVYFGSILSGQVNGRGAGAFHMLLLCVAALVALQCGLHFLASWLSPGDGKAPRDERERLIAWRSHSIGYQVLMVLVVLLSLPAHFGHPVPDLLNFALLFVVIAALVVAVAQIIMFRRGV